MTAPSRAAAAPADDGLPRRICMAISSYAPVVGGAERQVAQLSALIAEAGHDVRVVTRRYPGLAAEEVVDGIPVRRTAATGPKPVASARFVVSAARALGRARPDVVHCHSMFSPALAGILSRRLLRHPVIVKPMCGGEATSIARKPLGRRRLAMLGREVSRFVAVSREIEEELIGLGLPAERIRLIPNGVDTRLFHPAPHAAAKRALRRELGLPLDGPLFLFAGRIARQKRLPLLLEAWRGAGPGLAGATLLVAGANRATPSRHQAGASDAAEVPAALLEQPGVRFLGHVADMPRHLRAADAFVLPSAAEGLSNALLEACASGLAVVATRVGGTEDVLRDGESGILFAPDDAAALRCALVGLAGDGELRRRLGASAARTVRDRYDIRRTAAALMAEYAALTAPAPR